jgi:hypothetical protein
MDSMMLEYFVTQCVLQAWVVLDQDLLVMGKDDIKSNVNIKLYLVQHLYQGTVYLEAISVEDGS